MPKFYAVRAGHHRGVFETWPECQAQVSGYSGAVYKSFSTREDAEAFVAGQNPKQTTDEPDRFYAVAVGTRPGIYNDWPSASAALAGAKGPKYKRFDTHIEALNFIREKGNLAAWKAVGLVGAADEDDESDHDHGDKGAKIEPPSKKAKTATLEKLLDELEIWTDGASRGNGKAGAVAGVGVFFGKDDPRNISEPLPGMPQTNQRAELSAIMRALQTVPITQHVLIYSDSKYSISCVTEWYVGWAKNGWKTNTGDVKNRDLVQAVRDIIQQRDAKGTSTRFQWVKGHSSNAGNVAADELAVRGCQDR